MISFMLCAIILLLDTVRCRQMKMKMKMKMKTRAF